jgi:hypothetical protein
VVGLIFTSIWLGPINLDQGTTTIIGVIVGALISTLVALNLQRNQYKRDSFLEKRDTVYRPLFEDFINLRKLLDHHAYPYFITYQLEQQGRLIRSQISWLAWSDIKSDDRIILVPKWMRNALDNYCKVISQYNDRISSCQAEVGNRLVEDLKQRGLIESASGFGELRVILLKSYDTRIVTSFGSMDHGSKEKFKEFEDVSDKLIPELFRKYGDMDCVKELRSYYTNQVLANAEWIMNKLEDVLRYIETKYGSQDRLI